MKKPQKCGFFLHEGEWRLHTVQEIRREYDRLDEIFGIDTGGIEIAFSPRAVYQYGCCRYEKRGKKLIPTRILIASFLVNEDEPFWDTVRHEYAHAVTAILTGRNHGHDKVWADICRKIGTDPQRLAKSCRTQADTRQKKIKYRICCLTCQKEYLRLRRGRFVDAVLANPEKPVPYRCSCGGQRFSIENVQ